MANIEVGFRPSVNPGKEGSIYLRVVKNKMAAVIRTKYHIFPEEWDHDKHLIITDVSERYELLSSINKHLCCDVGRLNAIIEWYEKKRSGYKVNDIIRMYKTKSDVQFFFHFMRQNIQMYRQMGRLRTSETYVAALNSFMRFRQGQDILIDSLSSDLMIMYEAYLHRRGVVRNTSSFYMRILRAVYNRAVEKGLVEQRYPFRHVYTGVDKTVKRAISIPEIRRLKNIDLSDRPALDFARDMFFFSFYTRGMSFIDMAYLKKSNLRNGVLTYRRHKTGQLLFIRWEKCMQEIVDKHKTDISNLYLLPILNSEDCCEHIQYKAEQLRINRNLKIIAGLTSIPVNLTLYVARHSWASIAKYKDIPVSVISESMGHDSETTTQIYLASLDNTRIDDANKIVINSIYGF